jgi:uncharacterized phage protein gp47/JayE
MPMARPTPEQLRDRIQAEFDVLLPGADPRRRRSIEGVLARVQALVSHELLGAIEWASRQMHIATAGEEELPERAAVWGITPTPAASARGLVVLTGNVGGVVPAGAELRRADDSRYLTQADCTIGPGGTGSVEVVAALPGAERNAPPMTSLALIEPVANVQSLALVDVDGLGGGLSAEGLEGLRARARARIQEPPHGGAAHDYVAWVREVVGNTKVWVRPITPEVGSLSVSFIMPDASIPDPATVDLVAQNIDAKRPVTASMVYVAAPVAHLVAFTIQLSPDSVANRQAVSAELADMFAREAEPGGTLPRSRLGAAISAAVGEYSHVLTLPAGDVVSAPGTIARLGVITWL